MTTLENLTAGASVRGLTASGAATVESVQWIGQQALKAIFRGGESHLAERLLYRDVQPSLELVEMGRPWFFDSDGCSRLMREDEAGRPSSQSVL